MTTEIILVLAVLFIAVVLIVTERIKMEVVALLVLVTLAVSGLVTPQQALSGFSNPAVITLLGMFIIGAGLTRTGVAAIIGRQMLRLAGTGEVRLIAVIMVTAGVMSAFINSTGVAAMMLPVVMDLSRRTGNSPSRLLLPLAFGILLGGLTTLIGSSPNLLISEALRDAGLTPFGLFDFTPVGGVIMLGGILFMLLVGRHLLPTRVPAEKLSESSGADLEGLYDLREHLSILRLPGNSPLAGRNLVESRLGTALHLNVVAILRNGELLLAPRPDTLLNGGDRLVVQGRPDALDELRTWRYQAAAEGEQSLARLLADNCGVVEAGLSPRSSLVGQSLFESELRHQLNATVIAIQSHELLRRTNFQSIPLRAGDSLVMMGTTKELDVLKETGHFSYVDPISLDELTRTYQLHERILALNILPDSALAGRTLAESRLRDAWGLSVLAIMRGSEMIVMPEAGDTIQPDDTLLAQGRVEDLETLHALQALKLEPQSAADLARLESAEVGLAEVVLSPHSRFVGQTLRRIHFRDKYDLNVIAIWREGRAYREDLRDMPLRLGDALLVYGAREKVNLLGTEPDFLVLTEAAQETPRFEKAPLAALIMVAAMTPVLLEWIDIAIAGLLGGTLMILLGCLTLEEAMRAIDMKGILLIAGMLPLGIAMDQTGAAALAAGLVLGSLDHLGPQVVMTALYALTTLATQVMPNPAVAVLMAPIALSSAAELGLSPHALMMIVAVATSGCFLGPMSHPANVMVMGPGGYRFSDYTRVGLPLSLVVLALLLLTLPIFWPA